MLSNDDIIIRYVNHYISSLGLITFVVMYIKCIHDGALWITVPFRPNSFSSSKNSDQLLKTENNFSNLKSTSQWASYFGQIINQLLKLEISFSQNTNHESTTQTWNQLFTKHKSRINYTNLKSAFNFPKCFSHAIYWISRIWLTSFFFYWIRQIRLYVCIKINVTCTVVASLI